MKLWHKVILAMIFGVLFGYVVGQTGVFGAANIEDSRHFLTYYIKPIGIVFINLIKMVVIPLIFFSLISGITSMNDMEAFKRVGTKSVAAYMCTSAFAVTLGIIFGIVLEPGMGVDLSELETVAGVTMASASEPVVHDGLIPLLVNMVPVNAIDSMAKDEVLRVVIFAVFVAVTMNLLGDKVRDLVHITQQAALVVFKLIEIVIRFSPYGVFALIAWTVGTQGFDILVALITLVGVVVGALATHFVLLGVILAVVGRLKPGPFYKKMLEPQSIAFSTSSSKATLSTVMRVMNERMGVSQTSTSFILPLGASINMDGTAIYLAICCLFFSQAFGMPLDYNDFITMILTVTIGSIGAAGIPGGSFIMMGMVLASVGLPATGIALILGVDRILDMLRTALNVTGDGAITILVDKSEGTFNEADYYNDKL